MSPSDQWTITSHSIHRIHRTTEADSFLGHQPVEDSIFSMAVWAGVLQEV